MAMSEANKQKARERMLAMHAEKRAAKQPIKINTGGAEAGIMQPSGESTKRIRPVELLSESQAEADLDELGVDEWVRKHYSLSDMTIDMMASTLRESREEIYNRLHFLGFPLPEGTYNVSD